MGSIPGWCWVKVIPKTLRMVAVPACMVLRMKQEPQNNWSTWCQYNLTGWVNMWGYEMLSHIKIIKRALSLTATNRHLIS